MNQKSHWKLLVEILQEKEFNVSPVDLLRQGVRKFPGRDKDIEFHIAEEEEAALSGLNEGSQERIELPITL